MTTDSSKRVPAATSAPTTTPPPHPPPATRYGIMHAYGMGLSSRLPCQHRNLKQGSTSKQSAQQHTQYQGYLALKTQSLAK